MRQYSNDIIGHLHWLAAHGKAATDEEWQSFRQCFISLPSEGGRLRLAADSLPPGFIERLSAYGYVPKLRETNLCILIRLGFCPTECAVLMGMSISALSNLRKRLNTRMFGISGGAREFDEKIRQL